MTIRIGRTLPPAAAPIPIIDILQAFPSCFSNETEDFCFEEEIKQEFGQHYCLLVSSGKAALVMILKALRKLYPGRDEVIIPAFTCYSVPAAIKKAGFKIKLCDTGDNSLDLDKRQLKRIIEKDREKNKILCVLVTHLLGCPADVNEIRKIVGDIIPVVEDAAQAMGEEVVQKKIGTLADVGFFSFGRGKALSTIEGGGIVTNRKDLGDELLRETELIGTLGVFDNLKIALKAILVTFLQKPSLFWIPKALPFLKLGETIYDENFSIVKMSSFQKRLSSCWQKRLQRHQEVRKKNGLFWRKSIPDNLVQICSEKKLISLIRFPVLATCISEREELCLQSEKNGYGIMPTYPTSIDAIPQISEDFKGQSYPNAKRLADCLLTLPVHEYVNESDRLKINKLLLSIKSGL